jgi:Ca-activated chloride channel family protein
MTDLTDLHLLRPLWLLALLPACVLVWLWRRRQADVAWRQVIAPHLLGHLLTDEEQSSSRVPPMYLIAAFWCVATLALAGPAWQREPTPFADDSAALIIALYLGPSMLATDIQPTRLQRSVHKIRDLLALRKGARVALIAYAGSAHKVVPFTTDRDLIETFSGELAPDLMPLEGNDPKAAIVMAQEMFARTNQVGSVLLITDNLDPAALTGLENQAPVDILAVAPPPEAEVAAGGPAASPLDRRAMTDAAELLNGQLVEVSVDDSDVVKLARRLDLRPTAIPADSEQRWRDAGYYLLLPIALIVMLWLRQGWVVRWSS